jgi:hypothetical protein
MAALVDGYAVDENGSVEYRRRTGQPKTIN